MSIIIARLDERLIHGQVALAWLRSYKVDTVVVVDDESAHDPMKKMLLEMAVSGQEKCLVLSVEEAIEHFKKNVSGKIFLVVKSVVTLKKLMNAGVIIPEINIGGIYTRKDRKQYFKTIFLTESEKELLLTLADYPTHVDYRVIPNDEPVDIISRLKKL